MAHIDNLVAQVEDPALRARIAEQVAILVNRKQFGLVFQDHLPEMKLLNVVKDFGEPIYAGLRPLGTIARGDDNPSHVVIQGENYYAL